jgi:CheY-like chemotaxis protein
LAGRRLVDGDDLADEPSLAWRRVLVIEDQIDSLDVIAALLRQQGAIVRAFETAEHALAAAENGSFDLVISDLGMPGMDGMEFMQRLKRHPRPVKAIALTAYADDKNRAQAVAAGFSRVMTKPIAPAVFLDAVRAELEDLPRR